MFVVEDVDDHHSLMSCSDVWDADGPQSSQFTSLFFFFFLFWFAHDVEVERPRLSVPLSQGPPRPGSKQGKASGRVLSGAPHRCPRSISRCRSQNTVACPEKVDDGRSQKLAPS